jgi:dTDP-4-amino-4,6-dideoxygalactose transaminase
MDPAGVEAAITPRTRAIIPTDLFGFAAPWDDVLGELARDKKITLIEDAAHAAGSTIFGRPVGKTCRLAFFSLETIKVMHSFGGGVVVLDDEDLAQSIRSRLPQTPPASTFVPKKFARNLVENLMFRTPAYQAALVARGNPTVERGLLALYNRVKYSGVLVDSAYSGWQAAFALEQLKNLPERMQTRRSLARKLMDSLDDLFVFPKEAPGVLSNCYFLVGRSEHDPKELQRALVREGIDTGALGEITDFCPPETEAQKERFPHAYRAFRSLLQLPFYEGMTEPEMDRIVSVLRRVAKRRV